MGGLVVIFVVVLAFAVLDILAQTSGVDSRPDFDDMRAPARGLS